MSNGYKIFNVFVEDKKSYHKRIAKIKRLANTLTVYGDSPREYCLGDIWRS